jgi:adenosylmethionine-8-amino-7-oxononanoate aminotransferase
MPPRPAAAPASFVFHRKLRHPLPWVVRGQGCWLIDAAGRRYLDGSGGALVANLGHDLEDVARAVAAEIRRLGYVSGAQFTHGAVEELAVVLADLLPRPLEVSYFLSSGSEAIEAAVKLARQLQLERGQPGKWKVISRIPSYHGNTLAALALGGREHYRRTYGPLLLDFPRIPAPDPYRDPEGPGSTGAALEEEILRQGPDTVAAFLYEPIGGSSSGAVVPSPRYVDTVFATCRRHDVLVIADEVMCGMGRTGRWLAAQHFPHVPDIAVLGKGLNAGAMPLSAVLARREHVELLRRGSGAFNHAQTYSHHPAACAAGVATVRRLQEERLVERVAEREPRFQAALAPLRDHRLVGDVRGKGFMAAVELVADRAEKRPFDRARRVAERLADAAFAAGLIVWPNAGNVDGERGDLVMLGPPFVASDDELDEIGRRLGRALDTLAGELESEAP